MNCNYGIVIDVEELQLQRSCHYDNVVVVKVIVRKVLELWKSQV